MKKIIGMAKASEPIFVYGTLKKNQENGHFLTLANFIGEFVTAESCFGMIKAEVPYIFKKEKGNFILGEVYKVDLDTLTQLDNLEDNGQLYIRELINIRNLNYKAWCYICPKSILQKHNLMENEFKKQSINQILVW